MNIYIYIYVCVIDPIYTYIFTAILDHASNRATCLDPGFHPAISQSIFLCFDLGGLRHSLACRPWILARHKS